MGSCKLRVVQKEVVQKELYKRVVINMGGCTKGELSKGVGSKKGIVKWGDCTIGALSRWVVVPKGCCKRGCNNGVLLVKG